MIRNLRIPRLALVAGLAFSSAAWGQSSFLRSLQLGSPARNSIRLEGVSGYVGYTSNATPAGGGPMSTGERFGSDLEAGGSAGVAWQNTGARGGFSGVYSISYTGNVRYSDWNSLNHALSLSARTRLGRRWTFSLTAAGSASSLSQYVFSPTVFGYIAAMPGSFDDLAAAVLAGAWSSDQIASLLTGVPVVESPARSLFYGNRVLSTSAAASIEWRRSPRFQIQASAGAGRSQQLPAARGEDPLPDQAAWLPRSTSVNASLGFSYSLTPRTQIGGQASGSRTLNPLQNAYTGAATFSVGRKMGRNWFADGRGGVAVIRNIRSVLVVPERPQYVAGGTLGYRARPHTVLVSHDKTASDGSGVLASSTQVTSGAWNWSRPGGSWAVFAGGGQQRMRSPGLRMDGWMAGAGIGRVLGRGASMQLAYSYLWNSGAFDGTAGLLAREFTRHSVRLEISWSPAGEGGR